MLPDIQRTIVALASGPRPAERAIIRLAGPDTRHLLALLCPELPSEFLDARSLQTCDCLCQLPITHNSLPVTLLFWPNERSYTGGPAAEIHMIGCLPLAEAVIQQCCQLGAQPAARGEFTLRAFLAGKLDLAQAEAVLGVIEADTADSLKAALSQLGGNLAPAIAPLREKLIDIVAELEAGLDFVDEDIEFISQSQVIEQLNHVNEQLEQFSSRLDTRSSTERVPQVVLAGLPNSGKSSLFNALCQQPLAIVAELAGTTRDYLQHRIRFESVDFDLIDTAGWEELHDLTPRAMAQQQLHTCLEQAQLGLLCIDLSKWNSAASHLADHWQALSESTALRRWLIVGTKLDLVRDGDLVDARRMLERAAHDLHAIGVETTTSTDRRSIEDLMRDIASTLLNTEKESGTAEVAGPLAVVHETAVRCRAALSAARAGLAAAIETAQCGGGEELIAAELRLVLDDLATIIGEVHSDDVLGEIFSRFCIGK